MAARFTIAIPTHDRCETVLLAVASALRQTRPAAHVLVLCDGCTDGTAAAVRALGEPTVEALELRKGRGYAYEHRNLPLARPDADVVLWLADDDLLLPDHLEQLGRVWDAEPDHVMVTAPAVLVHEDDRLQWLTRDWSVPAVRRALLEHENHCPMASVSVRAAAARAAGGWRASDEREGDRSLWTRMLAGDGRVTLTDPPSVLHFRATTREQPWPDRVRQNRTWLARLADPEECGRIRQGMRTARAQREGEEYAQLLELHAALERATAERGRLRAAEEHQRARAEAAERRDAELAAERDDAREQLATVAAERDDARAQLATVIAERDRHARTLRAIYAGGWWRLRARLLPLRRRAGGGG